MRKATPFLVLLFLLATASSASAQTDATPAPAAAAADVDPVGTYDFVATLGIEDRTGTLEIVRGDTGGLRGEAWLEGEGQPAVIESGAVAGNHVSLYAFVGGGAQVTFELDFEGDTFSGVATADGQTITMEGTRRP